MPIFLDLSQAAEYLGVTRRWLADNYLAQGIPHHKLSHKMLRFKAFELDRWAARRKAS